MLKKDLFVLINSMTSSEKRLYKLKKITYQKDSKLASVFDWFTKYNDYNKLEKFLTQQKEFKRIGKFYSELYENLLSFFAEEEIKKTRSFKLYQKIFAAKNLMSRQLVEQADNILKKVIKEAEYYEMYEILLLASILQQHIFNNKSKFKKSDVHIKKIIQRKENAMKQLSDIYIKTLLCDQLFSQHRLKGAFNNQEEQEFYQQKIDTIDFDNDDNYRTQRRNLLLKIIYTKVINQRKQSCEEQGKLYHLYKKHEHISKLNIREYSYTINNYAAALVEFKEFDKATIVLKEMKELIEEYDELRFLEKNYLGLKLSYFIKAQDVKECLRYAKIVSKKIITSKDVTYKNYISVKIIVAFIINKKYNEGIDFINTILNDQVNFLRKDCFALILIYEIFIYLKLGYFKLIESKMKNLKNFLKNHYQKDIFEEWSIQFLNQYSKKDSSNEQQIIINAQTEIKELKKIELAKNIIEMGDVEIWLEHELKNI